MFHVHTSRNKKQMSPDELVRWSDGQLFFTHGEFVIIAVFIYHVFRSFR